MTLGSQSRTLGRISLAAGEKDPGAEWCQVLRAHGVRLHSRDTLGTWTRLAKSEACLGFSPARPGMSLPR